MIVGIILKIRIMLPPIMITITILTTIIIIIQGKTNRKGKT